MRDRWLNPPEWVERVEEPVAGYPKRPVPRDEDAATALKKRTLTKLYNARPQWLGDGNRLVLPMRSGRAIAMSTLPKMLQYHEVAAVPHGFRSSFRDWAAEETDHPREVIEAALAYVVQNKVEAAPAGRSSPGTGCVHRTGRRDLDEPLGDDCDDKHLICCRQDV